MNLLLVKKIRPDAQTPDFGEAFRLHMAGKTHPDVRLASLNAWSLLAEGLETLGQPLHAAAFRESGKPFFPAAELHFSLSHGGGFAAALIADNPCGVDIEPIRELPERLYARCMHPDEIAAGMDFFEVWTKKECLAKLEGAGMPSYPCRISTLEHAGWLTQLIGSKENICRLSAICLNGERIDYME